MTNRLPQDWINMLTQRLMPESIPGKTWPDFNKDMRYWHHLWMLVRQGLISEDDMPPRPNPSDYKEV